MKLDRDRKLTLSGNRPGITVLGACTIGHARRCPRTDIEPGVCISPGVRLEVSFLGCGSFVGEGTRLLSAGSVGRFVTIGEGCLIGAGVPESREVLSVSYPMREKGIPWCADWLPVKEPWKKKGSLKKTFIGNDVYIGDRCLVPQGLRIGDGAFLYPGTVPEEDVPPYGMVRGNPGRLVGFRFSPEEIRRLLTLKWWEQGVRLVNVLSAEDQEAGDFCKVLEKMAGVQDTLPPLPKEDTLFSFRHEEGNAAIYRREAGQEHLLWQFPA